MSREVLVLSWAPFKCLPAQALVFLGEGHAHGLSLSISLSSSPPFFLSLFVSLLLSLSPYLNPLYLLILLWLLTEYFPLLFSVS